MMMLVIVSDARIAWTRGMNRVDRVSLTSDGEAESILLFFPVRGQQYDRAAEQARSEPSERSISPVLPTSIPSRSLPSFKCPSDEFERQQQDQIPPTGSSNPSNPIQSDASEARPQLTGRISNFTF